MGFIQTLSVGFYLQCLDFVFICSLTFFKMDSSSECGTKLDFSNESIPPPLIKTVSDPVIEIKKADTFTKKAFDFMYGMLLFVRYSSCQDS